MWSYFSSGNYFSKSFVSKDGWKNTCEYSILNLIKIFYIVLISFLCFLSSRIPVRAKLHIHPASTVADNGCSPWATLINLTRSVYSRAVLYSALIYRDRIWQFSPSLDLSCKWIHPPILSSVFVLIVLSSIKAIWPLKANVREICLNWAEKKMSKLLEL